MIRFVSILAPGITRFRLRRLWPISTLIGCTIVFFFTACIQDPASFSGDDDHTDPNLDDVGFDDANTAPPGCADELHQCPADDGTFFCVDLNGDQNHCGGCGQQCSTDIEYADGLCIDGSCASECIDDRTECDGICRDLDADPDHCGSCDLQCSTGACDAGQCAPYPCDPGATPFGGGRGLLTDPYTICSAAQLQHIGHHPSYASEHFVLSDDINLLELTDDNDNPADFKMIETFSGTLDGFDFAIENLTLDLNNHDIALFRIVEPFGQISNLTMHNVDISGNARVAGLVADNYGVLSNIHVDGRVEGDIAVGGLTGRNHGTIVDSTTDIEVVATTRRAGGLLGYNHSGTVSGCASSGTVQGDQDSIGGLVGENQALIKDSTSDARVESRGDGQVGGLVGRNSGFINLSSAHGDVESSTPNTGGLVGFSYAQSRIENSYATGRVIIIESFDHSSAIGGLVGGAIDDCLIIDSFAEGDLEATEAQALVGGLVGLLDNQCQITRSYATGTVAADKAYHVGGLVGDMRKDAALSQSFATGNVIAFDEVGGLVGRLLEKDNSITNSYATGDVDTIRETDNTAGGLVGNNLGKITHSYSAGAVTTTGEYLGGLVGQDHGEIAGCYWDTETSGHSSSPGGLGLTTQQFLTATEFENAGWNFDTIWMIPGDEELAADDLTRPRLQWEF